MTVNTPTANWQASSPLTPGVHFWRVHGVLGSVTGNPSPAWEITVKSRAVSTPDMSYGTTDDFDGDGFPDVVLASQHTGCTDDDVGAWYSGGHALTGTLGNTSTYFVFNNPGSNSETFSNVGDVNGDGYADLVVNPYGGLPQSLFLGGPSGLSATAHTVGCGYPNPFSMQSQPSQLALGDVDGDGYTDIAGECTCGGTAWCIFYGDANAALTRQSQLPTTATFNIVGIGDENGDGYSDVGLWNMASNTVYIYTGGPSGLSATSGAVASFSGGSNNQLDMLGDLNGDGYSDFNINTNIYFGPISTASTPVTGPSGGILDPAGDVNGDGLDDVMTGTGVFYGRAGAVGPSTTVNSNFPTAIWSGGVPGYGPAGDLDGDGYDDVLGITAANGSGNWVSAYYGSGGGLTKPTGGLNFNMIGCAWGQSELACVTPKPTTGITGVGARRRGKSG
jgi:hypothetical protein